MAFQDSSNYVAGASITWQSSGGTNLITCTSLAAGSARQGAKGGTLLIAPPNGATTSLPDFLQIDLTVQMTSAPAAGGEVGVYLGFSDSITAGTGNPGGLGGTDAALSNVDVLPQLVFAGSVILSNSIGTGVQYQRLAKVPPQGQYPIPVIYNNGSVALDATALHTVLTITPYWRERLT